ncbi:hypothetical protein EMMF5_003253 [Cystobasidiomycetes sp. EMM_F5]
MKIAYVGNFADAMPGKTFIKVGALECHKKVKLTKQIFAENASEGTLKPQVELLNSKYQPYEA